MGGLDWGDVPTWLASMFGAGAFLGALLLFRVEAKRDNRHDKSERERQASLVTAWIRYNENRDALNVHIQNASTACVYDVYVHFSTSGRSLDYELRGVVPPSKENELIIPVPEAVTEGVGAENSVTLCDLQVFVYEATEPVSSQRAGWSQRRADGRGLRAAADGAIGADGGCRNARCTRPTSPRGGAVR